MTDQTPPPVTGVTPYVFIDGVKTAAEFYKKAFDATEVALMASEDGKRVMHCHLSINGGPLMMSDFFPEHGFAPVAPQAYMLHLQVAETQPWWDRAVAAGVEIVTPLETQFWGDRYGQVRDPFGITWSIGGPK